MLGWHNRYFGIILCRYSVFFSLIYSKFSYVSLYVILSLQMSELLNQKSSARGKIPSGYLNAIFELSGDWFNDAADTKYLAFDGYFISLYYLHLTASPLVLQEDVKKAVPSRWDPASLSRWFSP